MEKGGSYAAWHQKEHYELYHWAIVLVVALFVGSFSLSAISVANFKADLSISQAATTKWVSGFYAVWTATAYPPSTIDFSSLTHIMMFSALPKTDGSLDTARGL